MRTSHSLLQPVLRPVLQPALRSVFDASGGASPSPDAQVQALFANGEQGAWYDPSDLSTMFQDASGTTPVTAVEQSVGLMLDKRRGLKRGPEMLSNGDFSGGAAGWGVAGADATHVVDFTGGACRYRSDTTSPVLLVSQGSLSIVAGRWYELTIVVSSWVSGSIKTDTFNGTAPAGLVLASSAGTFRVIGLATATTSVFSFLRNAANTDLTIDSISVRELPGNHRWQGTATSRPVLSARYNMLVSTEQLDSASWSKIGFSVTPNAVQAPDGTMSADKLVSAASTSITRRVEQSVAFVVGTSYTATARFMAAEWRYAVMNAPEAIFGTRDDFIVDLLSGTITLNAGNRGSVRALGGGWYELSYTRTCTTAGSGAIRVGGTTSPATVVSDGDGVSGLYVWGVDIRPANGGVGIPPYQRVADASNYDTVGFPLYRKPDGVDDWMQTSAVDFSGTDKVTIAAAVRKLSDTSAMFAESSPDSSTVNGTFGVNLAPGALAGSIGARLRGTAAAGANAPGHASPKSLVAILALDIAKGDWGSSMSVRVNGVPQATAQEPAFTAAVGTGNFGSYPLYFDRRGGITLPSSARDYGTLIVGRLLTGPETAAVEKFLRQKSRAY